MNRRSISYWHDSLPAGDLDTLRPALPGDTDVDVAVVGGGFTGLWTAYYLAKSDPSLRIAVLEKDFAGFGASGRNGGWASGLLPASWEQVAKESSRSEALRFQREANASVDVVGQVAAEEGIDGHYAKGGYLKIATSPLQRQRLEAELAHARSWDQGDDDLMWLDRSAASQHVNADGVFGALYNPHCAAIHPARMVRGLAEAAERRGVTIYEDTPVTAIEPGRAMTERGTVRAEVIVRALEGYTASLPQYRRALVPIYSLMIATEPIPEDIWKEIGWSQRETLNDDRRFLIYAQRTADGRIALGGRGAPYHWGSRIDPAFEHPRGVHDSLHRSLVQLFPALQDVAITHRWGGVLGVPRDWFPSVRFDRASGFATAGGYAGDGVTLTNLAGRTLADLILGNASDLTTLPWVGRTSRDFEPEPFRFIGINTGFRLADWVDRREQHTGKQAVILDKAMSLLTGH
ncbi:MAG TPA: FAD-binding oxidoreductase [Actinomycetes bacterium]|nr:FAD-binding oxidoreductase [Actinomycetes bacterium]